MESNRRNFLRQSFASASAFAAATMMPADLFGYGNINAGIPEEIILKPESRPAPKDSIRFSVIGINHSHIFGMVDSLVGGGGKLVAVYSREPELLPDFTRRFPSAKIAKSEEEILEDNYHSAGGECLHSGRPGTSWHQGHAVRKGFYDRQAGHTHL